SSYFGVFVFFFSSRRRHTRFSRDWSSDVCSSDLIAVVDGEVPGRIVGLDHIAEGGKGFPRQGFDGQGRQRGGSHGKLRENPGEAPGSGNDPCRRAGARRPGASGGEAGVEAEARDLPDLLQAGVEFGGPFIVTPG